MTTSTGQSSARPQSKPRVLLVDDSAPTVMFVAVALQRVGYEVLVARSLSELDQLRRSSVHPDLVLMDVQMPEAFGDDVAMIMREVWGVSIPILLFSNLDEEELERRAREAEVDGYICKRAGLEALIRRVQSMVPPAGQA
jgi:DNA-binding response OmpR family regulator